MAFRKDQIVQGSASGRRYRIESGPYKVTRDGEEGYLVELVGEGSYSVQWANALHPSPLKAGDRGRMDGGPVYTLYSIDDRVVVLWMNDPNTPDGRMWWAVRRARLDVEWEPQP